MPMRKLVSPTHPLDPSVVELVAQFHCVAWVDHGPELDYDLGPMNEKQTAR